MQTPEAHIQHALRPDYEMAQRPDWVLLILIALVLLITAAVLWFNVQDDSTRPGLWPSAVDMMGTAPSDAADAVTEAAGTDNTEVLETFTITDIVDIDDVPESAFINDDNTTETVLSDEPHTHSLQ